MIRIGLVKPIWKDADFELVLSISFIVEIKNPVAKFYLMYFAAVNIFKINYDNLWLLS